MRGDGTRMAKQASTGHTAPGPCGKDANFGRRTLDDLFRGGGTVRGRDLGDWRLPGRRLGTKIGDGVAAMSPFVVI